MRIGIIGRTEILYDTASVLRSRGHDVVFVVTSREAPEYKRTSEDFRQLCHEWGIPFLASPRIEEANAIIRDARPDVGVSMNYVGLIPQATIDLFPYGIMNAHGGDLPRYRGNACQAWAILNGESRIGLCVHKMMGGALDSGDIIARDFLPIDHNTKVTQVWNWMTRRVPELFVEAVSALGLDRSFVLERQSQDPLDAHRCYPRRPEDARINWTADALGVLRLVNASNRPYGGAFCSLDGATVIVWDAEIVEDGEVFSAVPGQVTLVDSGFIDVACGNGKLRIRRMEVAGRVAAPTEWVKSIRHRLA